MLKMAGQKDQTYLCPWCCPSPWLTSPPVCWSGLHIQLHIQHGLAHSQLSDFSCSILIWPQKRQAGGTARGNGGGCTLCWAGHRDGQGSCWFTPDQAVPPNTAHSWVRDKKKAGRQTDRHPPPCWVAVHCPHTQALRRQPPPQPCHPAQTLDKAEPPPGKGED